MVKNNYFNKNLKYIRIKKGITQQEIADKLKINRSSISRWENNEMEATIGNAISVSNYFNISLNDFIFKDLSMSSASAFFSKNLKYLREKKDISKNKLGNMIGVNQTTIGRWENEEIIPSINNVEEVSKALNVDLIDLLTKELSIQKGD